MEPVRKLLLQTKPRCWEVRWYRSTFVYALNSEINLSNWMNRVIEYSSQRLSCSVRSLCRRQLSNPKSWQAAKPRIGSACTSTTKNRTLLETTIQMNSADTLTTNRQWITTALCQQLYFCRVQKRHPAGATIKVVRKYVDLCSRVHFIHRPRSTSCNSSCPSLTFIG